MMAFRAEKMPRDTDYPCDCTMESRMSKMTASGAEKPGVPADRVRHSAWEEQPQWRPDADGEITNAAKCKVTVPPSAVGNLSDSIEEPVEVARYSIDGRLLTEPERGVNIVKMSDGTAHKEIVK